MYSEELEAAFANVRAVLRRYQVEKHDNFYPPKHTPSPSDVASEHEDEPKNLTTLMDETRIDWYIACLAACYRPYKPPQAIFDMSTRRAPSMVYFPWTPTDPPESYEVVMEQCKYFKQKERVINDHPIVKWDWQKHKGNWTFPGASKLGGRSMKNLKNDPMWSDADPFSMFSLPIPRMYDLDRPIPSEEYFDYRESKWVRPGQRILAPSKPYFIANCDSAPATKRKRRAELLATPDHKAYISVPPEERVHHETWLDLEYNYRTEKSYDRRWKDESDLSKVETATKAFRYYQNMYDPSENTIVYGNNSRNRKMAKGGMVAVPHWWMDQSEEAYWDPNDDSDGGIKCCLEILPPDEIGTMCIVREYYDDDCRRIGPILRALEKAISDNYDLIMVDPHRLGCFVAGWIEIGDYFQIYIIGAFWYGIYKVIMRPQDVYVWGTIGYSSIILYHAYRLCWEIDPLAKYSYHPYMNYENMAEYFYPGGQEADMLRRKERYEAFNRAPMHTILNKYCTILRLRKFPWDIGFKKVVMRCSYAILAVLMFWRTGWPPVVYCPIPCRFIPMVQNKGDSVVGKWKWYPLPRLLELPDYLPQKSLGMYQHLRVFVRSGYIFGLIAAYLCYRNWLRKSPYRSGIIPEDLPREELEYWDFTQVPEDDYEED